MHEGGYLRAREAAGPNRGVPSGARIAHVAIGAAGAVVDRFAHIANARNERDVDTIFEVLKRRGIGARNATIRLTGNAADEV